MVMNKVEPIKSGLDRMSPVYAKAVLTRRINDRARLIKRHENRKRREEEGLNKRSRDEE